MNSTQPVTPRDIVERFYRLCLNGDPAEAQMLLAPGVTYTLKGDAELNLKGPTSIAQHIAERKLGHARQLLFIHEHPNGCEAELRLVTPGAEEQIITERTRVDNEMIVSFEAVLAME
jgi:hypothetical protein